MKLKTGSLKLIDPGRTSLTLVPNSGIQFLDYLVDPVTSKNLSFRFYDHDVVLETTEEVSHNRLRAHPVIEESFEDDEDIDDEDKTWRSTLSDGPSNIATDKTYNVTARKAIDVFDRQWLPLPFFRNDQSFGPTNWARVYFAKAAVDDEEQNHRLVLAFDTEIIEQQLGQDYAGPGEEDVRMPTVYFALAKTIEEQLGFIGGKWQKEWIKQAYIDGLKRLNPKQESKDYSLSGEPGAHYAVFLQALQQMLEFPNLTLIDTYTMAEDASRKGTKILSHLDVDLVLDVGNSRSCGVIVEPGAVEECVGLGQQPARLEIRDLSRPDRVTSDPFDSRVEFQPASFGHSRFGRGSGRPRSKDAFIWPSPIRIGDEASWLSALTDGRDGVSGMSSPKRYVWDKIARQQSWVNNRAGRAIDERLPPIRSAISSQLTSNGRLVGKGSEHSLSMEKQYSRGSIYMLMLAEIICHALTQINSASYRLHRADSDLPRRLKNIFLTLPSATPVAEQHKMQKYARQAIKLVWSALGWEDDWLHPKPKLNFNWDEATCTQLVYLYDQLEHRFQRFPKEFFNLMGKGRTVNGDPAMRIASLDIGGGTTDLMVIEHQLFDEIITPNQLFREGFRQAGDDVLKEVVEQSVLPAIANSLERSGVTHSEELITALFGGDTSDITRPEQVRRSLFTNQVLIPAALRLMKEYCKTDSRFEHEEVYFTFADLDELQNAQPDTIDYLDSAARKRGGVEFKTADVVLNLSAAEIAGAVNAVLDRVLADACDIVRAYDCDLFLITGRTSGLPAVHDIIRANAPVTPERIVQMYGYRVGNWYPFRSDDFRIWDPKTTAAVGAYLCHLCQGKHASFVFESNKLKVRSTAKYIGKLDQQGRLSKDDVLFTNNSDTDASEQEFKVRMGSRVDIGYRQLPIERWVTSQLYHVYYRSDQHAIRTPKPVTVTMKRQDISGDVENMNENDKEQFKIIDAEDAHGNPCNDAVDSRLQTVRTVDQVEAGYWLDTGVLTTTHLLSRGIHNA